MPAGTITGRVVRCEVWVVVDGDGDYEVGTGREEAEGNYAAEVAGPDCVAGERGVRRVRVWVDVPLPADLDLVVQAPAEGGPAAGC